MVVGLLVFLLVCIFCFLLVACLSVTAALVGLGLT